MAKKKKINTETGINVPGVVQTHAFVKLRTSSLVLSSEKLLMRR